MRINPLLCFILASQTTLSLSTKQKKQIKMSSSSSTQTQQSTTTTAPRPTWRQYQHAISAAHKDTTTLFNQLPSLGPLQMINDFVRSGCSFRAGVVNMEGELELRATIGKEGSGEGEFLWPYGVVQLHNGDLAVSDFDAHNIQVFRHPDWSFCRRIGSKGSAPGQFSRPCGLAVNSVGNILVADRDNHRIQELTVTGDFIRSFGQNAVTNLCVLPSPGSVAVNSCDELFACNGNQVLCGLRSDGGFVASVTEAEGVKFQNLYSLCVTPNDEIVVTDYGNHRVVMLRSDGTFIRSFGSLDGSNRLQFPYSVACDADGNMFVSDEDANLHAFRSDGTFIRSFRDLKLQDARGVAVLSDGSLAICDYQARNVQIWK